MPSKPTLLYWDSCVFISAIQRTADRYPTLKAILDLAELDSDNTAPVHQADDIAAIWRFFENDYIAIHNVDRHIAEKAADLVRHYNIKPLDAIHVATALSSRCCCLQTYDKQLLRLDGKVGWPALSIKPPSHPEGKSGSTLF